jgi:hypothetical protein
MYRIAEPRLVKRAKDGGCDRDRTCDPYHVKEAPGTKMKEFQRLNKPYWGGNSPDVPSVFMPFGSLNQRELLFQ